MHQLEAEAAEKVRVEREGLVVLRLRMADLFAKRDSIVTKMDSPIANIKGTQPYIFAIAYATGSYMFMYMLSHKSSPANYFLSLS